MSYLKALCLAALVFAIFGITAATASAETELPSILFLPGNSEGELKGSSETAKTKFTGIQNLTGTGYNISEQGKDMAELGAAQLSFKNITLGTKKCSTEGDGAGTVLIPNAEWHLAAGLGTEPGLTLFLLPSGGVKVACEGVSVTVTGSSATEGSPVDTETTSVTGSTGACSGSNPAFSEYANMSGGMSKVELKSEVGGIKAKSCTEIEGTISFTASHDVEVMKP